MSLKRRNLIAYLLILAAALAWTAGQKISNRIPGAENDAAAATTFSAIRRETGSEPETSAPYLEEQNAMEAATRMPGEDFSESFFKNSAENLTEGLYGDSPEYVTEGFSEDYSDSFSEISYEELSAAFPEDPTEEFSETVADIFSTEFYSAEPPSEAFSLLSPALWGFLLRTFGIAAAFVSVFLLFQKAPFTGPDGAGVLLTLAGVLRLNGASADRRPAVILFFLTILLLLYALRELWGWLWNRCPLSWCVLCRFMMNSRRTWLSFPLLFVWNLAAFLLLIDLIRQYPFTGAPLILAGLLIMGLSGMGCLYKYAADLRHFQKQLEQFQNGLPVTAKEHSLIHAERQLSAVQSRHEEAIQTAVTSERFKVELISNVSHDLRTPLTSILGYGELLVWINWQTQ